MLALAFLQYALHSLNHLIDVGEAAPGVARARPTSSSLLLTCVLLGWMITAERRESA